MAINRQAIALSSVGADFVPLLEAIVTVVANPPDSFPTSSISSTRTLLLGATFQLAQDIERARQGEVLANHKLFSDKALDPASHVPPFPKDAINLGSLVSFAAAEKERGFTSSAICGALFCLTQLANYTLHSHAFQPPSATTPETSVILPFCGGSLPCYAISQTSEAEQGISLGVCISRLAFWMGLQSDRAAALARRDGYSGNASSPSGLDTSESEQIRGLGSWCLSVSGFLIEDIQAKIDRINSRVGQGQQLRLEISAVMLDQSFSIVGPPSLLDALELVLLREASESTSSSSPKRSFRVPVFSPYHFSESLSKFVEPFLDVTSQLGLYQPDARLRSSVYSTVDGLRLTGDRMEPMEIVEMIYLRCCRWDKVVRRLVEDTVANKDQSLQVINVGPGGRLGQGILGALADAGIDCSSGNDRISLLDIEASTLSMAKVCVKNVEKPTTATKPEEIAIVGHACRFPGGAQTPAEFWEFLKQGKVKLEKVPKSRFDADLYTEYARPGQPNTMHEGCVYGAFLEEADRFDARLFSISPREAQQTDPQHRIFTMVAHEAMEKAGYAPDKTSSFARDRIGTFLGASVDDYRDNASLDIGSFLITGNARAFMPGRISFLNQWSGPSASVDTGEMSSLTAIETACDSLLAGNCDTALVGAVSVFSSPAGWITLDKASLLARNGSEKAMEPFSPSADGWLRAEGCGVLVLKRLSQAIAEGDNIVATIPAVTSNYSPSPRAGLFGSTADRDAKEETQRLGMEQIRSRAKNLANCLSKAGLSPAALDHVECNASGFAEDEEAELEALSSLLGNSGAKKFSIGSVKAHIGNAEAASGMASIFKVIGMIQDGFSNGLQTSQEALTLLEKHSNTFEVGPGSEVEIAAVNDYSLGGGNSTMLIKRFTSPKQEEEPQRADPRRILPFALSAKTKCSLERQLRKLGQLVRDGGELRLEELCYTATDRRSSKHPYRFGTTATSLDQLVDALASPTIVQAPTGAAATPKAAFFFSGQGSQYAGMGKRLAHANRVFRASLEECERILVDGLGFPGFLDALMGDADLDHAKVQYAIFSIQFSLVKLLEDAGIRPSAVGGHSLGEYAALAVSKVLSLRDALFLVATRARLLVANVEPYQAGMLSTRMSATSVSEFLAKHAQAESKGCEIACENGPNSTVISGPKKQLEECLTLLKGQGQKAIILDVAFAFHSSSVEPILEGLAKAASEVTFSAPEIPILSNVTGELVMEEGVFSPEYLCKHSRGRVRFTEGVQSLVKGASRSDLGLELVNLQVGIEIGPDSIVLPMVRDTVSGMDKAAVGSKMLSLLLPTLKKGKEDDEMVAKGLISSWLAGLPVDWFGYNDSYLDASDRRRLYDFPTYSFEMDRHWIDYKDRGLIKPGSVVRVKGEDEGPEHGAHLHHASSSSPSSSEQTLPKSRHSLLRPLAFEEYANGQGGMAMFEASCREEMIQMIKGHRVSGIALVPAALNAAMCLEAASYVYRRLMGTDDSPRLQMNNLHITGPLTWHLDDSMKDRNPTIKVRCTADLSSSSSPTFSCMVSTEGSRKSKKASSNNNQSQKHGSLTSLHATCNITPSASDQELRNEFSRLEPLLVREVRRLEDAAATRGSKLEEEEEEEEEAPVCAGSKLAYQLFTKVVEYDPMYHSMDNLILSPRVSLATAHLGGKHERNLASSVRKGEEKDDYFVHPLSLDATSQLAGLAANLFWTDQEHVYVTESCTEAKISPELEECQELGEAVVVLATVREEETAVQGSPASAVIGDCFILRRQGSKKEGLKLIASITGAKYGRLRSKGLQAVLKRTLDTI
ncbi:ketoacyl-synt-domain-containing protein [Violaceomyces palustris]|uniref:Ketoacyl-synt-domain-containing protein n=1 Tax=Violaceomyces palustris TaxID=1673888 RepID=A0ACD0NUJ8_9BASI|nr:ketoacyl-synt-domain-containing protein [Violaceomyces palustris]